MVFFRRPRQYILFDERLGRAAHGYVVRRLNKGWQVRLLQAPTGFSQTFIYLCHHDRFVCFYAPLASRQLDWHLYEYVYARLEHSNHFEENMVVDYMLIQQSSSKLIVGMAYDPAASVAKGVHMIDSVYMSMYRLFLCVHRQKYLDKPILVLCVDPIMVSAFAYGEGVWGYARIIHLADAEQSMAAAVTDVLQRNPIALQHIDAHLYVWFDAVTQNALSAMMQDTTMQHFCCLNVRDYLVGDHADLSGHELLFAIGSSLWGK